ncbi:ty3-gypsy retrotransposon protein [Cucumis melo var. makuwa]|uniref:Ty3-gypsy retrotransposon protein n=1 Tax=Cucumis melo var. makuwa TaxID=1194695 RepID=A0A5D3DE42_CUCMM|nr:ty3-gypsy retrotransposon protein [Cucumis melo var. makuwa]
MITSTIRDQYGGTPQASFMYFKPYTKTIDDLRMSFGSRRDQLVMQFVQSPKENAFKWYADLESEVTDNRKPSKRKFLNRFYSTRHIVNIIELTNTMKWKRESVIDYIYRWRALSLDCKDKLNELVYSGDVHPRPALGVSLYFAMYKTS